jgi:hypothetical protein
MFKGNFEDFARALGQRESSNKYYCQNKFGYLGRWQFGKERLWDLGYSINGWKPRFRKLKTVIPRNEFLLDANLQDTVFKMHIKELRKRVYAKFKKHLGTVVNDIVITESGCVAGMHLKGEGGLKKFLRGKDNADANGTKISEYIYKFGNYDLSNSKIDSDSIPVKPIEPIETFRS